MSRTQHEAKGGTSDRRCDTAAWPTDSTDSHERAEARRLAEAIKRMPPLDKVDIASMESFPCSDPPGY